MHALIEKTAKHPQSLIGRLELEALADRLFHAITVAAPKHRQEECVAIANELSELARRERRMLEQFETQGTVLPPALRDALQLKTPKAARLLYRLMHDADKLVHRAVLIRALETTSAGLSTMICEVRAALLPLGLRADLRTIGVAYTLSSQAAEAIAAHCQRDGAARLRALPVPTPPAPPPAALVQVPAAAWQVDNDAGEAGEEEAVSEGGAEGLQGLRPGLRLLAVLHHSSAPGGASQTKRQKGREADVQGMFLELIRQRGGMVLHLMLLLGSNPGRFVEVSELVAALGCTPASLKVTVCKLRKQFADGGMPNPIESARGEGYRMSEAALAAIAELGDALVESRLASGDAVPEAPAPAAVTAALPRQRRAAA